MKPFSLVPMIRGVKLLAAAYGTPQVRWLLQPVSEHAPPRLVAETSTWCIQRFLNGYATCGERREWTQDLMHGLKNPKWTDMGLTAGVPAHGLEGWGSAHVSMLPAYDALQVVDHESWRLLASAAQRALLLEDSGSRDWCVMPKGVWRLTANQGSLLYSEQCLIPLQQLPDGWLRVRSELLALLDPWRSMRVAVQCGWLWAFVNDEYLFGMQQLVQMGQRLPMPPEPGGLQCALLPFKPVVGTKPKTVDATVRVVDVLAPQPSMNLIGPGEAHPFQLPFQLPCFDARRLHGFGEDQSATYYVFPKSQDGLSMGFMTSYLERQLTEIVWPLLL